MFNRKYVFKGSISIAMFDYRSVMVISTSNQLPGLWVMDRRQQSVWLPRNCCDMPPDCTCDMRRFYSESRGKVLLKLLLKTFFSNKIWQSWLVSFGGLRTGLLPRLISNDDFCSAANITCTLFSRFPQSKFMLCRALLCSSVPQYLCSM